jgi:hypothetical protein
MRYPRVPFLLETTLRRLIGRKSLRSIASDFFGMRSNECGIKTSCKLTTSMKIIKHPYNVCVDHIPVGLEKRHRKTIRLGVLPLFIPFTTSKTLSSNSFSNLEASSILD